MSDAPSPPLSSTPSRVFIGPGFKRVAYALLVLAGCLAPPLFRVHWEGTQELQAAQEAGQKGDTEARIVHLGRAARWYLPLFSHDEEALMTLIDIGQQAQDTVVPVELVAGEKNSRNTPEDGLELALRAFREARGAILSTRTWDVAHPQTLADINRRIATLMAEQERRLGTDLSGIGQPYELHLGLLETIPAQRSRGTWVAAAAFVGWLAALLGLGLRTFDRENRFSGRRAFFWGMGAALGLVVWMILMRHPQMMDALP